MKRNGKGEEKMENSKKLSRSKIERAALYSLAITNLEESRYAAFQYAIQALINEDRDKYRDPIERLRDALHARIGRAYQDVFMWGLVSPETTRQARKIAFNKFLTDSSAIMQYLQIDGHLPSMWSEKEEKEFRAELDAAKRAGGGGR